MIRAACILFAVGLAGSVGAAEPAADPGIYGPIDTARFSRPELINRKPVLAATARQSAVAKASTGKPLYLHVPPRQVSHWQAHCADYDACDAPVFFVTEGWFLNVYLPAVGGADGREQRYREQMGRDRELRRDAHAERADD